MYQLSIQCDESDFNAWNQQNLKLIYLIKVIRPEKYDISRPLVRIQLSSLHCQIDLSRLSSRLVSLILIVRSLYSFKKKLYPRHWEMRSFFIIYFVLRICYFVLFLSLQDIFEKSCDSSYTFIQIMRFCLLSMHLARLDITFQVVYHDIRFCKIQRCIVSKLAFFIKPKS